MIVAMLARLTAFERATPPPSAPLENRAHGVRHSHKRLVIAKRTCAFHSRGAFELGTDDL
jgi:hypothetical protein